MDDFKVKHKFWKIALAVFLCLLGTYLFHTWNAFEKMAIKTDFFIENQSAAANSSKYVYFEDEKSGVLYSDLDETETVFTNSILFSWAYQEGLMILESESGEVIELIYCDGDCFFLANGNVFLYRVAWQ